MKKGFTLIELIIVVLIIGVVVSISIPVFVDMQRKAIIANENYIIGCLAEALSHNMISYQEQLRRGEGVFGILEIAPPVIDAGTGDIPPPDGYHWRTKTTQQTGLGEPHVEETFVYCPHYNGSTIGKSWVYMSNWFESEWLGGWSLTEDQDFGH